jgi:hypothetical protein
MLRLKTFSKKYYNSMKSNLLNEISDAEIQPPKSPEGGLCGGASLEKCC